MTSEKLKINWKKNLFFVWLSQFLSLAGFGFGLPFAAYYIQELGITDRGEIKFWTAMFQAGAPMTLAIMSPLWGMLADRYGRKLMLLRANLGAAVVVYLMGSVPSVQWLIMLRLAQGMFTGTVTAAQTLVATSTPEGNQGVALGTLSTAVFSGLMAGAFFGGLAAETFGYADAFKIGAGLLMLSSLLILCAVREDFAPPDQDACTAQTRGTIPMKRVWRLPDFGPGFPLLVLIAGVSLARRLDMPILPLFVQDMNGGLDGAAAWSGMLSAAGCSALILSGLVMGRMVDRFPAPVVAKISAIGAAIFMLLTGVAVNFLHLFVARFLMLFCAGGLDPVFQVWLSRVTTKERRGAVFGWAVTAKSLSWVVAPLFSAFIAARFGRFLDHAGTFDFAAILLNPAQNFPVDLWHRLLWFVCRMGGMDLRGIFFLSAMTFVLLVPLISWATRRMLQ